MKKISFIFFGCVSFVLILYLISMNLYPQKIAINIATFNLRMDTPYDSINTWSNRKEMVKGLIRFYDFDIVGTQEGFKHQIDDILELGGYAYIGSGRDDGQEKGEHSAIIYKKNSFDLLDFGDFWFSENPTSPGKGWDAKCCNRICSWGKFREKKTGKEFFVFNAHYDHQGKIARKNSSFLLLKKIKEITNISSTVFVTGDFNSKPTDEPITILADDGLLRDSYYLSKTPRYGTEGTSNSFDVNAPMLKRIDYIWVTKNVCVNKYAVLNDMQYGRFPSDHFPVLIKACF